MEKLIELLNEYEKSGLNEFEEYVEWWYCKWNGKILRGKWENDNELTPYELCSKQYGFIKWLVDNDEIDKSKVFSFIDTYDKPYEDILCLLALSDEPISDLINILK